MKGFIGMGRKVQLTPVFVKTKNVRNFESMMDGLMLNEGEGCLGMVYGRAGRGKTRTTQWYAANRGCVYLRVAAIWKNSEKEFLRALCFELGVIDPPKHKVPAYNMVLERLLSEPKPAVFIDEFEKLPVSFLDVVRDLSDVSLVPFVLIGEEGLVNYMERDRRVWSRTFQNLEFKPIEIADIILFAREAAGLKVGIDVANLLLNSAGGDFRLVKRYLLALYHAASAEKRDEITAEMVNITIKSQLKGR